MSREEACNNLAVLLEAEHRMLRKALKLALEATDRTPPTITARPLLESVINLLTSSYTLLSKIIECLGLEETRHSRGGEGST